MPLSLVCRPGLRRMPGSGKTKVLIDRVARLLLQRPDGRPGAPPDSILCITYTKAAANEMLSRLFSRLGDWSVADDGALRRTSWRSWRVGTRRPIPPTICGKPGPCSPARWKHQADCELRRSTRFALGYCAGFHSKPGSRPASRKSRMMKPTPSGRLSWLPVWKSAAESHPAEMKTLAEATGGLGVGAALDALKFKRQELQTFARGDRSGRKLRSSHSRRSRGRGCGYRVQFCTRRCSPNLPESDLRAAVEALSAIDKPGASDLKLRDALSLLLDADDARERYEIYMRALAGAPKAIFRVAVTLLRPRQGHWWRTCSRVTSEKAMPEGREITRLKAVQAELAAAEAAERTIALMRIGLPMVEAYSEAETPARRA